MTQWDLILGPIWLIFFYIIAAIIVKVKYPDGSMTKYFFWGLSLKFLGAIAFALVYQFYYGGGDTFRYFENANTLYELAFTNPFRFLSYLSQTRLPYSAYSDLHGITNMFSASNTYMVTRFAVIFGLFSGMSYLPVTFCFTFFSFIGLWLFFRTLISIYPNVEFKYLAIPIFFVPSYFFWGSSIMQDSLVIGFLGSLVYSFYQLFILGRWKLLSMLLLLFSLYVLFNVKEYVLLAYVPALLIWVIFAWQQKVNNIKLKLFLRPVTLVAVLLIFIVGLPSLSQLSKSYSIDNVLKKAEVTSNYVHRISLESGGSAYNLDIEYTPLGLLTAFPRAVNVSLFRPYLWEVKNPVMLLSAFEAVVFLVLTILLFFKLGISGFTRSIYNDSFLFSALVFALFFSFAVGASASNFGSLVRYKIPMIPFYGLVLGLTYFNTKVRLKKPRASS